VSNWTLVANVSGIVAVGASLIAVLLVIPLVLLRGVLASSRPVSDASSRSDFRARAKRRRAASIREVDLGLAQATIDLVERAGRAEIRAEGGTEDAVIRILLGKGAAGGEFSGKWRFRRNLGRPVVRLPLRSAVLSDVLRSTARGLEEQADIIAQQEGFSDG
jgi:hypothetical protein